MGKALGREPVANGFGIGEKGPVMGEKGVPLEMPMGGWERARLT